MNADSRGLPNVVPRLAANKVGGGQPVDRRNSCLYADCIQGFENAGLNIYIEIIEE